MKILLVDDDIFLRDMYAMKFKEHGDDVQTAQNGDEALRMIAAEGYDVVITDMVMPGMSGVELLRAVHTNEATKNTKCITAKRTVYSPQIERIELIPVYFFFSNCFDKII